MPIYYKFSRNHKKLHEKSKISIKNLESFFDLFLNDVDENKVSFKDKEKKEGKEKKLQREIFSNTFLTEQKENEAVMRVSTLFNQKINFKNLKLKKIRNLNLKDFSQKKKNGEGNFASPLFSYEKACFLWEMYLKKVSFESQKKLSNLLKTSKEFNYTNKTINQNFLFNELDSLNIWSRPNKYSKFFKNPESNKEKYNRNLLYFKKEKKSSLFLKNIVHLKNVNEFQNKENYSFFPNCFSSTLKNKLFFKEKNSLFLASQNIKTSLIRIISFKLLNNKNNFSNHENLILKFRKISSLKDLKMLKKTIKKDFSNSKFLDTKKKTNALNSFFSTNKKQVLKREEKTKSLTKRLLRQLNFIKKYENVLEISKPLFFQPQFPITKKNIIKYRFPILMSGYPENVLDYFVESKQIFPKNPSFLINPLVSGNNVYNFEETLKKFSKLILKKQYLINGVGACVSPSFFEKKNFFNRKKIYPFLNLNKVNFQIEIQKKQNFYTSLLNKEKKYKRKLGTIKQKKVLSLKPQYQSKKLKKQDLLKNKKFVFFDHIFFLLKKKKNLQTNCLKKNIEQKLKKENTNSFLKKLSFSKSNFSFLKKRKSNLNFLKENQENLSTVRLFEILERKDKKTQKMIIRKPQRNSLNFVVSYNSSRFVTELFPKPRFLISKLSLKLTKLHEIQMISINFKKFREYFRNLRMLLNQYFSNFLNESYYLINPQRGFSFLSFKEKNKFSLFSLFEEKKNKKNFREKHLKKKKLDLSSSYEFFEEEKEGLKNKQQNNLKSSFLFKLKNLIKPLTLLYKNFSKRIFLIFKKIRTFFYQKIIKNFVFISLNQKNQKQINIYLSQKFINKKNLKQIQLKKTAEFQQLYDFSKNLKKKFLLSNPEKRKYEKIFRGYLSCKKDKVKKQKSKYLLLKKAHCDSIKNRIIGKEINLNFLTNFALSKISIKRKTFFAKKKESFKNPLTFLEKNKQKLFKDYFSKSNNLQVLKLNKSFSAFFLEEKRFFLENERFLRFSSLLEKKRLLLENKSFLRKKKKLKNLTVQLSPNEFLKKKHFIFIKEENVFSNLSSEQKFLKRLEKIKNFQKKRRLKKQKKETRRRKKRKRFYPRPLWLRFKTYKKFLETRHFKISIPDKKIQKFRQIKDSSFLKTKADNIQPILANVYSLKKISSDLLFSKEKAKKKFSSKKNQKLNPNFFLEMKITQAVLRKKIYRKNKQKWGYCIYETPLTEKILLKKSRLLGSLPLFNSRNFYQLSNTLKNDFQRMSWKSYWLRQNLTPYFQRVTSTLENMQESSIKKCFFRNFKSFVLNFLGFDIFEEKISNSYLNQNQIFLTLKKSPLSISKIQLKNSIEPKVFSINSSEYSQAFLFSEYQRILYNRMLESFKNIKQNLSGNGLFQARFFRASRRKFSSNEKQIKNFWQKLSHFINREIPTSAIYPSGYKTKLRLIWALNKTNLLTFKERNTIQALWSSVKLRDQKKSKRRSVLKKAFQDLRKILLNLKSQDLESLCFLKIQNKNQKIEILGSFLLKEKKQQNGKIEYFSVPKFFQLKMKLKSFLKKIVWEKKVFSKNLDLIDFFSLEKKDKQKKENKKFLYQPRFVRKRFLNYWWNTNFLNNSLIGNCFFLSNFQYSGSSVFLLSLWTCTLLVHLAIFFTILLIPEIRSLLKFQFLVFSKICLSLTIVIYYLYNGLKNWNLRLSFFKSNFLSQKQKLSNVKSISERFDKNFSSFSFKENKRKLKKFQLISKSSPSFQRKDRKKRELIFETNYFFKKEKSNLIFIEKTLSLKKIFFSLYGEKLTYSSLKNKTVRLFNFLNYTSILFSKKIKFLRNQKSSLLFDKYRMRFSKNITTFRLKIFLKDFFQSFLWIFRRSTNFLRKSNKFDNFSKKFLLKRKIFYLEYWRFKFFQISYFFNVTSPLTIFTILSLIVIKNFFQFSSKCFSLFYKVFIKFIDFFESILIIIYKFLEKPAEFLIEWMAQIFLIEWSSDRLVYVPETLDMEIWNSVYKTSRSLRGFSFPATFLIRGVWYLMETFFKFLNKPDKDLIYRQKKGILFWDLWADILLQIAEKYNLNIPSLNTLKEEQEFFMEKLLQDQDWNTYSTKIEQINPSYFSFSQNSFNKNSKLQKQLGKILNTKLDLINNQKNLSGLRKKIFQKSNKNLFLFKYPKIFLKQEFYKNRKFSFEKNKKIRRWSFHQDWIFQGRETDLFLDVHPPKSLSEVSNLKFSQLSHQPIATFVCQIFAGIFSKQVARNILLIGPPGLGKSLFVQAMAGETELQMITEHAHRYSLVSRGVAVGMKMLKHVFDSISFSTPCFFLIEDIHLIGEKRSISISDDQNAKAIDMNAGDEQEEVHEKNQVIYQLNRHSLGHYKKPYKGDFSLFIPTNHFCFDLFLGVSPPRTRHYLTGPSHPLPIDFIQNQLDQRTEKLNNFSNFDKFPIDNFSEKLVTHLQLPSRKFFSPPPTSPLTLFALKEQQNFQPKKVVKQMPWSGLSWDQIIRMPKTSYSVKTKIAMLAEVAQSHFTVKLEMITDLLVLIDNVRSVRGFIVFGTTHQPQILDPALRRPGRFDETISFPYLPNLLTRYQIFKTSVFHFSKTLDCFDYAVVCKNLSESQLSNFLLRAKFSLLNQSSQFISDSSREKIFVLDIQEKNKLFNFLFNNKNLDFIKDNNLLNSFKTRDSIKTKPYFSFSKFFTNSTSLENKSFHPFSKEKVREPFSKERRKRENIVTKISCENNLFENFSHLSFKNLSIKDLNSSFKIFLQNSSKNSLTTKNSFKKSLSRKKFDKGLEKLENGHPSKSLLTILRRLTFYSFIPSGPSNILAMTYFHVSKLLIHTNLLMDPTGFGFVLFSSKFFEISQNSGISISRLLFSSSNDLSFEFLRLFAGKIGEFFVFSSVKKNLQWTLNFEDFAQYRSLKNSQPLFNSVYSFYGIDEIWRSITSLAFSILQKRYFYSKNLLVSRLLFFENFSSFKEVVSPPVSFCHIPGKRYENLKRFEKDFYQKSSFTLSEKIHLVQQQRLNKKLYKKTIQELFLFPRNVQEFSVQKNQNGFNKRFYTNFNVSTRELIPINSSTIRTTSSNCYYRKRILARHKFSFVNNWWNGHLSEHNVETTFLSDVDWRYSFKESLGDVVIDFPDTEQYYNPRSRRWMLTSGYWADWNSFEKIFNEEIYYHFINESFNKALNFLENYREVLDHVAYKLLKNGFLKEIDLIVLFSRFFILNKASLPREKSKKKK